MIPHKIEIQENGLKIFWDKFTINNISAGSLRKNCPCAVCSSLPEGSHDMKIRRYSKEELTITKSEIIGNYALKILWSDGHNTGIYEFTKLKTLTEMENQNDFT